MKKIPTINIVCRRDKVHVNYTFNWVINLVNLILVIVFKYFSVYVEKVKIYWGQQYGFETN